MNSRNDRNYNANRSYIVQMNNFFGDANERNDRQYNRRDNNDRDARARSIIIGSRDIDTQFNLENLRHQQNRRVNQLLIN